MIAHETEGCTLRAACSTHKQGRRAHLVTDRRHSARCGVVAFGGVLELLEFLGRRFRQIHPITLP